MFKTILLPTDGSELSDKAMDAAFEIARISGGKIVALSVAEPYPFAPLAEAALSAEGAIYDESMKKLAQQNVQKVTDAARLANVPCETITSQSYHPYEEIINAATRLNCDVIVMASHGRRGLNKLFAGSQTQKVLTHSTIPVLVFR